MDWPLKQTFRMTPLKHKSGHVTICKRSFSSASCDVLINVQNLAVQGIVHTHRYTHTHISVHACVCGNMNAFRYYVILLIWVLCRQFTNNNKICNKLYYKFHKPTDFYRLLLLIFHWTILSIITYSLCHILFFFS